MVIFQQFEHDGDLYGPVFNKPFLLEVLRLQNFIEHVVR